MPVWCSLSDILPSGSVARLDVEADEPLILVLPACAEGGRSAVTSLEVSTADLSTTSDVAPWLTGAGDVLRRAAPRSDARLRCADEMGGNRVDVCSNRCGRDTGGCLEDSLATVPRPSMVCDLARRCTDSRGPSTESFLRSQRCRCFLR